LSVIIIAAALPALITALVICCILFLAALGGVAYLYQKRHPEYNQML
jgi:hypothetical protein